MPTYTFLCSNCFFEKNITISVKEYLEKYANNIMLAKCDNCLNLEFKRTYSQVSAKVCRSSNEIAEIAKEDAKKIVEKVNSGDLKTILDVYGE